MNGSATRLGKQAGDATSGTDQRSDGVSRPDDVGTFGTVFSTALTETRCRFVGRSAVCPSCRVPFEYGEAIVTSEAIRAAFPPERRSASRWLHPQCAVEVHEALADLIRLAVEGLTSRRGVQS